jgi:hypothetical protein
MPRLFTALLIVTLVFVFGSMPSWGKGPVSITQFGEPVWSINALKEAFTENPIAFQRDYKGKPFYVFGIVKEISAISLDLVTIIMYDVDKNDGVITFRIAKDKTEPIADIKLQQVITLVCADYDVNFGLLFPINCSIFQTYTDEEIDALRNKK